MRYTLLLLFTILFSSSHSQIYNLIVGTYTKGKSEGIYVYRFNTQRGIFLPNVVSKVATENPSYLVVSADQKFVYAVNENSGDNGTISAFSFDKTKGELKLLNKQVSGSDPCYVTIDSTGKFVLAANYNGGISVFKTNADGSLQPRIQNIEHDGYGVIYERQDKSHVHSVAFSPDQKYVFAADLGNDRLYQYKFDPADTKSPLKPADNPYITLSDGSGPRHFTFHPNGKYAYLLNELSGQIHTYAYTNGQMQEMQTIASTTIGDKFQKGSADIHVTPNSKFLYSSNRGKANNIAIFKVAHDGKLNEGGHQPVNAHPRNFVVDPTGKFLLAASKDQNTIQVFAINPNYGLLEDTGVKLEVDMPVCLKFVPVK